MCAPYRQIPPKRLETPAHLTRVMQSEEKTWARVVTLVQGSLNDVYHVVAAAPRGHLEKTVRTAGFGSLPPSISAPPSRQRNECKVVGDITREDSAAFFATLAPRERVSRDVVTQRLSRHTLMEEDAHLTTHCAAHIR